MSAPQPEQQHEPPGNDWGTPPPNQDSDTSLPVDPSADADDRIIAVLAHLSPIFAALLSAGLVSFLGPLLMWLIYKDRSPLVRNAAATSFNFHITVWLCWVVAWVLFVTIIGIPFAILLFVIPGITQIVLSIIGAVRARNGEKYSYPFQIRLLTA